MSQLIWDFNDFMSRDFSSISMGLTPSGHLHLGFLSTLACALMYLKEHPKSRLVITNVENSLSARLEKYSGVPLRFQHIEEGGLVIPANYEQLKIRNSAGRKIHAELNKLIWQLIQIFDKHTEETVRRIKERFIPEKQKKYLKQKENKIFHAFGTHIHVYSFISVLKHDRKFRKQLMRYLSDPEFARVICTLCELQGKVFDFGDHIMFKGKKYQPKGFQVPVRLYCPNCKQLCPGWATVVIGSPKLGEPALAALCTNVGNCPRADKRKGYDGYVYHNMKESLDMAEFHFMLDPMRDFFEPFKSDCHVFGGDYFQLEYEASGMKAVDKVKIIFDYLEKKTGQQKFFFGGPLITIGGRKMSKSGTAFNLKDLKKIKPAFINIIKALQEARAKSYPEGLKIEYTDIIRKTA